MFRTSLKGISKAVTSGLTPLRSNAEFWKNGEISWLKTEQIGDRHIYETNEYISKKALEQTSIKIIPSDAITIAMYGEGRTRGSVSIIKKPMTTNQACCNLIIDDTKADYNYVYYFLKTQYNNLRALSSGVRKNLNSEDIKTFQISIPDLSAQQKIAKVLSILDDKIELNNRINDNLEQMAKAIYDYWFVQFDFPNEFNKPYKSSGGAMVYEDILKRQIPKGWEVKSLLDIANFVNGLACQKYRPVDDNFLPVIKIREMNDGISQNTEKVRKDIPSKYIINDGDLLFSWSASLDVKIWSEGIGGLNQHIFKVTSSTYPQTYYYFELLNYLRHFKMMADLRKTTMGHITQEHLRDSKILVPSLYIINKLDEQLNPIFKKILVTKKQSQKLAALRDWLLPMLMNGQVTVK
ncbi:restriction endonuclease subunit S [Mucilaginibacter angelicae]|uniref:Restriction endonuclease subunit S n=1 Tax=Mucilaginibacter angelicae TaxID=869718 RepID=A0ABV6L7B9_9SPHI